MIQTEKKDKLKGIGTKLHNIEEKFRDRAERRAFRELRR
jgi:hypothetical protein